MKITKIFPLLLTIFTIIFSIYAYASTLQNTSGFAWTDNIGWISFNSTDDQDFDTGGIQPSPIDFGVNFDENTGIGSGYAWSSNIGWISFNDAEVSSNGDCPDKTSNCGPKINWLSDGSGEMVGFARACSVFQIGCSGDLNPDYTNGGWDGFIALGNGDPLWGVKVGTNGIATGYAWASDVVGWVSFNCANNGNDCQKSDYKVSLILAPKSCVAPQIQNPTNANRCEVPPDCAPTEVFNVAIWQCIEMLPPPIDGCPVGQIWDGMQCVDDSTGGTGGGGSGGTTCPTGQVYDTDTKKCVAKKKPWVKEF